MSEWGKSKRMNGLASWGTCRDAARERRERRALSRALHGGGRGRFWARGTERRTQARGHRAVEEVQRDAWGGSASRRWPG